MFTDNRKEEIGITGNQKGLEKEVFTSVNTSLGDTEELKDNIDISDSSQLFYSNQSTYNMDGESLW
ncbi:MAG TPA: hypothetical protein VLJ41_00685 [Segetibacter sp.]|nr:hypothetical protein [Segetibacter sp.]